MALLYLRHVKSGVHVFTNRMIWHSINVPLPCVTPSWEKHRLEPITTGRSMGGTRTLSTFRRLCQIWGISSFRLGWAVCVCGITKAAKLSGRQLHLFVFKFVINRYIVATPPYQNDRSRIYQRVDQIQNYHFQMALFFFSSLMGLFILVFLALLKQRLSLEFNKMQNVTKTPDVR